MGASCGCCTTQTIISRSSTIREGVFLRGPREIKLVERVVWAKHQSLPQGMASWVPESHSDLVPELAVSSTAKFSVLEIAVASEKSTSRTMAV